MEKTSKFTTITLWVLMIISVILFVVMVTSIDDQNDPSEKARQMINLNLNWAIVLFVISAVVAVGFAIVQIVTDKAKAIRGAGALALLAIVLVIAFMAAEGNIPEFFGVEKFVANGTLTESISRWVGTGLYVTYILFAGAFLSIIGFSAANMFKRS